MSRRDDDEPVAAIQYPDDGLRAVNVPLTELRVLLESGKIRDPQDPNNFSDALTAARQEADMEAVRSMAIFCDHDIELRGVYSEPVHLQAGWRVLQGIPELSKRFTIDLTDARTASGEAAVPEEATLQVYMWNTDYPQSFEHTNKVRAVTATGDITVPDGSWATILLRPSLPFNRETYYIENTGTDDFEYRVKHMAAGRERLQELDSSGSTKLTLKSGDTATITTDAATEFVKIEAQEPNASGGSTARTEQVGEA